LTDQRAHAVIDVGVERRLADPVEQRHLALQADQFRPGAVGLGSRVLLEPVSQYQARPVLPGRRPHSREQRQQLGRQGGLGFLRRSGHGVFSGSSGP
jgi:hypothetical protein